MLDQVQGDRGRHIPKLHDEIRYCLFIGHDALAMFQKESFRRRYIPEGALKLIHTSQPFNHQVLHLHRLLRLLWGVWKIILLRLYGD